MKLARLRVGTTTVLARIEDRGAVPLLMDNSDPWYDPIRDWISQGRPEMDDGVIGLSDATILAPLRAPSKIIGVGLNYRDHAEEQGKALPKSPMFFTKSPGAIIGPDMAIRFSVVDSPEVDYENELAVVIGTTARNVPAESALDFVLGYTICNDVSARDAQRDDGQFFRAKSFDTFCPLGPFVVSGDELGDPQNLAMRTRINGELRQNGTTANMIHGVAETVAYASRFFTLYPGDVITTGTPSGVGLGQNPPVFLKNGDVVECEIDGIGVLRNIVVTA